MPNKIALSRIRNRTLRRAVARGNGFQTARMMNMRQLPEDRINSVLACGSDAHRFMTEIEVLITRARHLISFRPPERKKPRKPSPRKSSTTLDCSGPRGTPPACAPDG